MNETPQSPATPTLAPEQSLRDAIGMVVWRLTQSTDPHCSGIDAYLRTISAHGAAAYDMCAQQGKPSIRQALAIFTQHYPVALERTSALVPNAPALLYQKVSQGMKAAATVTEKPYRQPEPPSGKLPPSIRKRQKNQEGGQITSQER